MLKHLRGARVMQDCKTGQLFVDTGVGGKCQSMGGGSWNDLSDRPFYVEPPTQVEILPETTVNLEGEWSELASEPLPKATEGEKYIVWWDGVPYECYCMFDGNIPFVGNPGLYYGDESLDDGTPFGVELTDGGYLEVSEPIGIHTIRIAKVVENVHTIEPKYLPKGGFGYSEEKIILEPQTLEHNSSVPLTLVVGQVYEVAFDNEIYICQAWDVGALGNGGFYDIGPSADEPFLFANGGIYYQDHGTHTVGITEKKVNTIEPKYMPCDMRIELNGYLYSSITADDVRITSGNVQNVIEKIWRGELVNVRIRSVKGEGSYRAQAQEVEANVCYYTGLLTVHWLCASDVGNWYSASIIFNADGTVRNVGNKRLATTT